ncbi:unnamed protein product, partial [Pleuronectes platessa]
AKHCLNISECYFSAPVASCRVHVESFMLWRLIFVNSSWCRVERDSMKITCSLMFTSRGEKTLN